MPGLGLSQRSTYLNDVLRESGYDLKNLTLDCDQSQFLKKIIYALRHHEDHPRNVAVFIKELQGHLDKSQNALVTALGPTSTTNDCQSALKQTQDSLVRLMLQVPEVQKSLIDWMLEKIALMGNDEEYERSLMSQSSQNVNLPQLLLLQLHFMDQFVDSKAVADKFIEVLEATSAESVYQEVILNLSDIVEEEHHGLFAIPLRDLMTAKPGLTNSILDAFTGLALEADILDEIRTSIIKTMDETVEYEDQPGVTQFILETGGGKDDATETARELRQKLRLSHNDNVLPMEPRKNKTNNDVDTMLLHIIKMKMASQKDLADAWLQVITEVGTADEHRPIDLAVLFLTHSFTSKRKLIMSIIKSKIRNGHFTEDLASKTLRRHANALGSVFDEIMLVADELCKSTEPTHTHYAHVIFRETFLHFSPGSRQEIIGDLITKISAGEAQKVRQIALKTLYSLVHEAVEEVSQFSIFIGQFLDHIDGLNLIEVRQIMDILSKLAFSGVGAGDLSNNLQILIRKQVQSSNIKLKQMGVTGACQLVKNLSQINPDETLNSTSVSTTSHGDSTRSRLSDASLRPLIQARKLLQLVREATKNVSDLGGLFMDELSSVIATGKMHPKLRDWITSTMTEDFTDDYIVDLIDSETKLENPPPDDYLPLSRQYNLDEDPEDGIVLNMTSFVVKSLIHERCTILSQGAMASRLIPHFRLLQKCMISRKQELGEIDALLACPVWLPKRNETLDKIESLSHEEKNVVCASLFYTANWFRELMNAFAISSSQDDKSKVLARLKNLISLTKDLEQCLKANPGFVPPSVLHLVNTSSWAPPNLTAKAPAGGGKKGGLGKLSKGRKRKAPADESRIEALNTQSQQRNVTQIGNEEEPEIEAKIQIDWVHYAVFFREIDLPVFDVLKFGKLDISSEPTEAIELKDPKLRPADLLFLLTDLHGKLEHSLISGKGKRIGGFGVSKASTLKESCFAGLDEHSSSEIAQSAGAKVKAIIEHLITIVGFFRNLIPNDDEPMAADLLSEERIVLAVDCFEKILVVLKTLISWNGFLANTQKPLLRAILCVMAKKINLNMKQNYDVDDLAQASISFLKTLSNSIVQIKIAEAQIKLMETVAALIQDSESRCKVEQVIAGEAENYLKRDWLSMDGVKEKGSKYHGHVETLLKTHLSLDPDPSDRIFSYVTEELPIVSQGQGSVSENFPTFTKATFAMHFRVLLENLVAQAKLLRFDDRGPTDEHKEILAAWQSLVINLHGLVNVLKYQGNRVFIASVLKYSKQFMEYFLRHCMPLMEKAFDRRRTDCLRLVKDMQQSTRYLQHVCNHSKLNKDSSLTSRVPALKRNLEVFVYKVKLMLANKNASAAFWLGNLKNRNLAGEEIKSQSIISTQETEDSDEEDNELPDDDPSDAEDNRRSSSPILRAVDDQEEETMDF